jgi:hypothetical protein
VYVRGGVCLSLLLESFYCLQLCVLCECVECLGVRSCHPSYEDLAPNSRSIPSNSLHRIFFISKFGGGKSEDKDADSDDMTAGESSKVDKVDSEVTVDHTEEEEGVEEDEEEEEEEGEDEDEEEGEDEEEEGDEEEGQEEGDGDEDDDKEEEL